MLVDAKNLLKRFKEQQKAVGAFNVSSIESLQAIFQACSIEKTKVFITTSSGESHYLIPEVVFSICKKLSEIYHVDYSLHLDHGDDEDWIKRCLDAGYNSIHADFGELEYERNVEATKEIRKITDNYNAQLEGELGVIPLMYYQDKLQNNLELTQPKQALEYISETGVDSLAISIGTQSGRYKNVKDMNLGLLIELNQLMPDLPFVLHGGSLLSKRQYQDCIRNGVAKININTELRLAYTKKLRMNMQDNPNEYAPYRLLKGCRKEMEKVVLEKLNIFRADN